MASSERSGDQRLDLVLVNPGAQKQVYQGLSSTLTAIEPPVWVGLIATFARNHGEMVRIIDAEAEGWSPERVGEEIGKLNPRLAAVIVFGSQPSASTQKMTAAGDTCGAIRRLAPDVKSILGGVHVSALPKKTLEEEPVDFVCEGEGPFTILGLLRVLKSENREALESVPGLWYRKSGEIISNLPAPISDDLDRDLPGVAWDLLPMEKYRAHNWHCFGRLNDRQPYAVLYTSLGCPFKCSFCCINAPFGKPSIRYRSPQSVIQEIDFLVQNYKVKSIKILDEMFVLNKKHVLDICDLLIERNYNLNFWAYARVDTVQEEMLEKMKKAGINWLALGIESGSKHVRDGVLKKFGQEDIQETVRAIQRAGINVIGNYIFGLPDDDLQSMQDTLDLALELNCEFANFYSAMAYPGSKLYNLAVEKGWPLPEKWHGFSQHGIDTLPLPTEHLTAGQVLKFRDEAFQIYFNNPRYLSYVKERFGLETVDHIREMASHKVERRWYRQIPTKQALPVI
ncbi:MAG: cobalamin B12-binding domain-containing protein [Nitrospirae bacterium]|nr:cobalamin B12-binding domain-containing protein [Candidatus Manganitrophaceae bacterium]